MGLRPASRKPRTFVVLDESLGSAVGKPRKANLMLSLDEKIAVIRDAVETGKQIHFTYQGHRRETCPHVLGTTDNVWRALVWQFGGTSSKGPMSIPNWRDIPLADISDLTTQAGEWHRGEVTGTRPQRAVEVVVAVVSPDRAALPTRIAKPRTPSLGTQRRNLKTRW